MVKCVNDERRCSDLTILGLPSSVTTLERNNMQQLTATYSVGKIDQTDLNILRRMFAFQRREFDFDATTVFLSTVRLSPASPNISLRSDERLQLPTGESNLFLDL